MPLAMPHISSNSSCVFPFQKIKLARCGLDFLFLFISIFSEKNFSQLAVNSHLLGSSVCLSDFYPQLKKLSSKDP